MSDTAPFRVAIACGGTGGHLFPGLAVAEEIRARGGEALLLISKKQIDATALAESDIARRVVRGTEGLQSRSPLALARFFFSLVLGVASSMRAIALFKPDAVLGMGGFTSFGPVAAARLFNIPSLIHESNALPGKANRLNARLASRVLLGLEACAAHFKADRCEVVGTPVRPAFRNLPDRDAARSLLGLGEVERVALFTGGSQGAKGLNILALGAARLLSKHGFGFIHLTGRADLERASALYRELGCPHHVAAFSQQMPLLFAASDVALSRAGAASLAEISATGLPALLVPYPHAAEDHQTRNAECFVAAGAAEMVAERLATPGQVAATLCALADPTRSAQIRAALAPLAPLDAHVKVANAIENLLHVRNR